MYALEDVVTDLMGRGRGYSVNRMYKCPFHDDSTASLSVNLDTGLWKCFGCGERGSLGWLARRLGSADVGNISLRLASRSAETTEDYSPPPLFDREARRTRRALHEDERGLSTWIAFCRERYIKTQVAGPYRVGWDTDKQALTFPYFNSEGRCGGIKYRDAGGHKWSATGSRYEFFGPSVVGRDTVVICEGESDTLRVASAIGDHTLVVGTSGASVSEAQWQALSVQLLFTNRVFLVYDADEPGDTCAGIAMRVLGEKALRVRPTQGNDITDHLTNGGTLDEIGLGATALHV